MPHVTGFPPQSEVLKCLLAKRSTLVSTSTRSRSPAPTRRRTAAPRSCPLPQVQDEAMRDLSRGVDNIRPVLGYGGPGVLVTARMTRGIARRSCQSALGKSNRRSPSKRALPKRALVPQNDVTQAGEAGLRVGT